MEVLWVIYYVALSSINSTTIVASIQGTLDKEVRPCGPNNVHIEQILDQATIRQRSKNIDICINLNDF